ncbi:MAG TPA: hypothetical protein VHA37_04320 [Candidatus Saccharimonadales bacterium]|nr:hypothetical protein [Candidatus Saccharimonadales bacterium]
MFDQVAAAPPAGDVFDQVEASLPADPEKEFREAEGRGPGYPLPHDSLERAAQDYWMQRRGGTMVPPGYVQPDVIKPAPSALERLGQKLGLVPGGEEIPPRPLEPDRDILARSGPSALLSVPARVAGTAGTVAKAALGDLGAAAVGDSADLGGNLKASLEDRGEPLPVERALAGNKAEDRAAHASGWQTVAADISLGLADLAPKVAMMEAAPGGMLLKSGASADIFGFNDKGEFSKKNAAFAAAFPFVTAGAAQVTDSAIKTAVDRGFTWAANPGAQRALHIAANQAAMNAVVVAQESPELMKLAASDPAEFKRELAKLIGSNLAFAVPEAIKEYAPAPGNGKGQMANGQWTEEPTAAGAAPASDTTTEAPAPAEPAGEVARLAPGEEIKQGLFGQAMRELTANKAAEAPAAAAEASAEPAVPVTRDLAAELEASMRGNQVAREAVQDFDPSEELNGLAPTVTREEASAPAVNSPEPVNLTRIPRSEVVPDDAQLSRIQDLELAVTDELHKKGVENPESFIRDLLEASGRPTPDEYEAGLQKMRDVLRGDRLPANFADNPESLLGMERPAASESAETVAKQIAPSEANGPVEDTVSGSEEEVKPEAEAGAPAEPAGGVEAWLDRAIEATNPLKGGQMMEGVTGAPVWLTKTLVHGTLRAVRAALRAGHKLADAIDVGLSWLKDSNAPGYDESEARKWLMDQTQAAGSTVALQARANEVSARLNEINTEARSPGALTDALKRERYQLSKESLAIQRALAKDPEHVGDLLRRMDQLTRELHNARTAGNGAHASEIGHELEGLMDSASQTIDPALFMRVYNDLVARGEIMKSKLGELPAGRTLGELTSWLQARKLDSPKLSLRERLNLGQQLAERWDRGKTTVAKVADQVAAAWEAFKAQWKQPPVDDEFRNVIKDWLYQKKWTGLETHRWVQEIRQQLPNALRRSALGVWLDAGGDEQLIRSQADLVPEKFRKFWDAALTLTRSEKELGYRIQTDFSQKLEDGLNMGLMKAGREDYGLPQLWRKAPETEQAYDPEAPTGKKEGSPRKAGARLDPRDPFFALQRTVPSYFDGIMAKGEPRSLDVGDLVAHYNTQFHEALADRTVIKALKNVKAADGSPGVMISGAARIEPAAEGGRVYFVDSGWRPKEAVTSDGRLYQNVDHWALKDWKFGTTTEDGNPVIVHGDFLVHPDYVRFLKNELGQSWFRQKTPDGGAAHPVAAGLLDAVAFLKASKFASAAFHGATIAEHALFHLVSPITRGVELDPGKNPQLGLLMRNGMELGFGGPQALFEEGLASHGGIWGQVPGLGDFMHGMSEYLFKDYIPKIKAKVGLAILQRNVARYGGKLSEQQIYELTARQVNAGFGMQDWRLMGTDKTLLDASRLLVVAPDFFLSRAKVVGQALKPYGREQRYFLLAQAAVVYGVCRALNLLLDKDPHTEPENALSVVAGGRAYSARFLVNDLWHLAQDSKSFASGRLGPVPRTLWDTVAQRDMRTGARLDVPFKTENNVWRAAQIAAKDVLMWLPPVGTEGLLPGAAGREQTGPGQLALGLVGVGSRKYTAQNQVQQWAADFRRNSPDAKTARLQEQRDNEAGQASDYRKLDALLDAGKPDQAAEEYEQLVKAGHDASSILRRYAGIARPFTGSKATEAQFRASLTPAQSVIYDRALTEREARWTAFQAMLAKTPAPAAAP